MQPFCRPAHIKDIVTRGVADVTREFIVNTETIAVLIPIFGIVFGVGVAIVAMLTEYRRRRTIIELHHKERMAAIEKGVDVPPLPDAFLQGKGGGRPRYLLRGLVWLFVGVGIFFALGAVAGQDEGMLGLIPAGVGLAYLIYYFVEGRGAAPAGIK
jgi:hypothetical protein